MSIYEIVAEKIMQQLEKGVVPWRQPWTARGMAVNWKTQRPYRGINVWLLEPGEYATFKQITEAGGRVKKGAKGHLVIFWKWLEIEENNEEGKTKKIPILRYYKVFEINTQCEGLTSRRKEETYKHDPIEEAERIIQKYKNAPSIQHQSGRAYYHKLYDLVSVPPLEDFRDPHEYYATLFHELAHSTGHPKRLNRKGIAMPATFGDETYSQEELVAEMTAAMLCGVAKIDNQILENSAAYIAGWLRVFRSDKRMLVHAAAQAQKAADYILGHAESEEEESDEN